MFACMDAASKQLAESYSIVQILWVRFVALTAISFWLAPRRSSPEQQTTYECGIPPRGSVHVRFFVRFFLVALFFLLFDLEAVFL